MAASPHSDVTGAAFTCRFTAALRHVEATCVPCPVLTDPLAAHLCGTKALELARKELEDLQQHQGPGKHLRVPARTRLLDEELAQALALLRPEQASGTSDQQPPKVQVCSLGAGMDTRPWRLQCLHQQVSWFDVDQPEVATLKRTALADAGAQTEASGTTAPAPRFPLLCGMYQLLGVDLAHVPLRDVLLPAGFSPDVPTIWVLEALIYYLPLTAAGALLQAMAQLSCQGSRVVLTCCDRDLLEASRSRMANGHVFANLWHFDDEELCSCEQFKEHWQVALGPVSTKTLALQLLDADTYVALYGGAETVIVAGLRSSE